MLSQLESIVLTKHWFILLFIVYLLKYLFEEEIQLAETKFLLDLIWKKCYKCLEYSKIFSIS